MVKIDIENLGCFGKARLIVESKPTARIYEVTTELGNGEENVVHGYVLLGSLVLNQDKENLSPEEVLLRGRDVTDEILATPWNQL